MMAIRSQRARTSSRSADTRRIARPLSRISSKEVSDVLRRADVEASRWLRGDDDRRILRQLAADDQLLLIPSGEALRRGAGPGRLDPEAIHQLAHVLIDLPPAQERQGPAELLPPLYPENRVLGQREREDKPKLPAVLRDVRDSQAVDLPRVLAEDVRSIDGGHSLRWLPESREGLDELALAVSLDAGDPEDLASVDVKGEVLHGDLLRVRLHGEALDMEDARSCTLRSLANGSLVAGGLTLREFNGLLSNELDRFTDHQPGEALRGRLRRPDVADHLPVSQDDDPISNRTDFLQLVGDEDDGLARLLQPSQEGKELIHLQGGEDRGWLVQDQEVDVARKDLEDLNALLFPHGELLHRDVQGNAEATLFHHLLEAFPRGRQMEASEWAAVAQGHVFCGGERSDKGEVLMDHPDPEVEGLAGT